MSTDEEIEEVYLTDIHSKAKQVRNKLGIYPFYDNFINGFHIDKWRSLKLNLSQSEREFMERLLARVYEEETKERTLS